MIKLPLDVAWKIRLSLVDAMNEIPQTDDQSLRQVFEHIQNAYDLIVEAINRG